MIPDGPGRRRPQVREGKRLRRGDDQRLGSGKCSLLLRPGPARSARTQAVPADYAATGIPEYGKPACYGAG